MHHLADLLERSHTLTCPLLRCRRLARKRKLASVKSSNSVLGPRSPPRIKVVDPTPSFDICYFVQLHFDRSASSAPQLVNHDRSLVHIAHPTDIYSAADQVDPTHSRCIHAGRQPSSRAGLDGDPAVVGQGGPGVGPARPSEGGQMAGAQVDGLRGGRQEGAGRRTRRECASTVLGFRVALGVPGQEGEPCPSRAAAGLSLTSQITLACSTPSDASLDCPQNDSEVNASFCLAVLSTRD